MSTTTIAIPDFPLIENVPDQGLVEFEPFEGSEYEKYIKAFNDRSFGRPIAPNRPSQPPFFISRASWKLLFQGKTRVFSDQHKSGYKTIKWVPDGYEVYGIVFCIAQMNPDHSPFFGITSNDLHYFRVRTILRKIGAQSTTQENWVEVETFNIAYVDLSIALENARKRTRRNCLRFISKQDYDRDVASRKKIKDVIDDGVTLWKSQNERGQESWVIWGEKDNEPAAIEQDGCIFGANRIKGVFERYPASKGSNVFLALNAAERSFSFVFRINANLATKLIDCPPPIPTCKSL